MVKIPAGKPTGEQIQKFRELAEQFIARTGYKAQHIVAVEMFLNEMSFGDMEKAIETMEEMLQPDQIERFREIKMNCEDGKVGAKKADGAWVLEYKQG